MANCGSEVPEYTEVLLYRKNESGVVKNSVESLLVNGRSLKAAKQS